MDEIPVYIGNVTKSYGLDVENVSDMQTLNELLIATAVSVQLKDTEELSVKHLREA